MKNIIIKSTIHVFSPRGHRARAAEPICENCRYYLHRDGFRICKLVGFTPEIARANENLCGPSGSFFEAVYRNK
jgi:hypothetical protein